MGDPRGSLTAPDGGFRSHFVQRAPLFRGLSSEGCAELVASARDRRVARRQLFTVEGERASEVFLLCAGRLKTTQLTPGGQEVIIRLTGPGEAFGGLGIAAGGAYAANDQALEPSHALVWDGRAFDAFAERNTAVLRNTARIVAERLRGLEQRYRELATERVPQRLAHALLRLVSQIGRPAEGGVLVPLSREELGQMTGTTLFTVSRLLGEWEGGGLVRPLRSAVIVADSPGLVRIAEGREPASAHGVGS